MGIALRNIRASAIGYTEKWSWKEHSVCYGTCVIIVLPFIFLNNKPLTHFILFGLMAITQSLIIILAKIPLDGFVKHNCLRGIPLHEGAWRGLFSACFFTSRGLSLSYILLESIILMLPGVVSYYPINKHRFFAFLKLYGIISSLLIILMVVFHWSD
jgi:hypothetical protein